jgi:3-isopropylmalate/(R)-2-methylmalate dehydratase small subunit
MQPMTQITGTTVVLGDANIDTDRIIPARFLTCTTRAGLGRHLFADWRYDEAGAPRPEFPLNRPEHAGATVLVAGDNFGCGSSREHAAWALADFGFRAIVSTSFADIFRTNALKNGLVPVVVEGDWYQALLGQPGVEVAIDLVSATVNTPTGRAVAFPLEPFVRHCLLTGVDELGYLLAHLPEIEAFERRRP